MNIKTATSQEGQSMATSTTSDGVPIFNPLDHGIHGVPLMVPAENYNKLLSIVNEVHAWAVCAPITSVGDFMQNLPRIIEITALNEKPLTP